MLRLSELVRSYEAHTGEIEVVGWIKTARESKNVGFIELGDGSCFKNVQVVYETNNINPNITKQLNTGTAIGVKGELVLTPEMQQPFEIRAREIEILGECDGDYPLQKKRHSLEYLRTIQHLRPRTNMFQAAFRVRGVVAQAIHRFFDERGFLYVHTPLITPSDCEGAGEMFRVTTLDMNDLPKTEDGKVDDSKDFFGREANLAVSGQLYGEAFAMAFRDIYLRPHVQGGIFLHGAPCGGVLDDRAGNGLLRPGRRHGSCRGNGKIHNTNRYGALPGRAEVLQQLC